MVVERHIVRGVTCIITSGVVELSTALPESMIPGRNAAVNPLEKSGAAAIRYGIFMV